MKDQLSVFALVILAMMLAWSFSALGADQAPKAKVADKDVVSAFGKAAPVIVNSSIKHIKIGFQNCDDMLCIKQ